MCWTPGSHLATSTNAVPRKRRSRRPPPRRRPPPHQHPPPRRRPPPRQHPQERTKKLLVGKFSKFRVQILRFSHVCDPWPAAFLFLYPTSAASFPSVSISVRGACQLPPSRRQPTHTHVQQRRGAVAVRHPPEPAGVSRGRGPGERGQRLPQTLLCCCHPVSLARL